MGSRSKFDGRGWRSKGGIKADNGIADNPKVPRAPRVLVLKTGRRFYNAKRK